MPKEIFPYYIGSFYEAFSKIPELRNLFLAGQNDDEFLDIDGVRWKIIQIDSLKESLLNYELDVQDILRLMGCDSQADDYLAAFEYKLAESNSEYKTDEQQKTEEQTISISEEIDAQTSIKSQKVEEPTIAEHKNANGNRLEGFFLGIGIFIGLVTAIIIEQTRSKTLSIISVFASLFFYFFSFFTIYFVSVKLNDCYQKRDKNDKKVSTYNKATILIIIIWISFALLVLSCLQ